MQDFGKLSVGQVADQVYKLILLLAAKGLVLPKKFKEIRDALYNGHGYVIMVRKIRVLAYAEIKEVPRMFILCSVCVDELYRGNVLGIQVAINRIKYAFALNPDKSICLVCSASLVRFYRKLGFIKMPKSSVPPELLGGRTMGEWQDSDRVWMIIPNKVYWEKRFKNV